MLKSWFTVIHSQKPYPQGPSLYDWDPTYMIQYVPPSRLGSVNHGGWEYNVEPRMRLNTSMDSLVKFKIKSPLKIPSYSAIYTIPNGDFP